MSTTKIIKGWVRPAGVDVHGPGYELGSGCGWCEFNEVGQPDHGDEPATLYIGPGKLWTEEEVLKLLHAIDSAIMQDRAQMAIRHTAAKHGLTL